MLRALAGLGGLAPRFLGSDLAGRWSEHPTVLISWLDGQADIKPAHPDAWAAQLGRALARVHAMPSERISALPSVFDRSGGSRERPMGPVAEGIRSSWPRITASPEARLITRHAYSFHRATAALALVLLTSGPITLHLPHQLHADGIE